ncbi:MAG: hypothetical protein ACI311_00710 [Bacilli bacterium]
MVQTLIIIFLIIELIVGITFLVINLKKIRNAFTQILFIILCFIIDFFVYLLPYIYGLVTSGQPINLNNVNIVFDLLEIIMNTIKLFAFDLKMSSIYSFTLSYPLYTINYFLAAFTSIVATITTTIYIFRNKILNYFRVKKCLKKEYCDIIITDSSSARKYAKSNSNVVIWVDLNYSKDIVKGLQEEGFKVIRKPFSIKTLKSKFFNNKTKYNFIYFNEKDDESFVPYVNLFTNFLKETRSFNFKLSIEVSCEKASVIKEEVIDKVDFKSNISLFNRYELEARTLIDKYPFTKYLPEGFINKDTTINNSKNIHVYMLGFGTTNQELLKQILLTNQFATVINDEYHSFLIDYFIYDKDEFTKNISQIGRLQHNEYISNKHKNRYFELPDKVANFNFMNTDIKDVEVFKKILNSVENKNTYTFIFVSFGDSYTNINLTEKLLVKFNQQKNFHIFTKVNNIDVGCNHINNTNYGEIDSVLTHDIIINDDLTRFAKAMYAGYSKLKENIPLRDLQLQINERWVAQDMLSINSNIYASLSLRTKLNLLGLDYCAKDANDLPAISKTDYFKKYLKFKTKVNESMGQYKEINLKNSLIAQEHIRWNTFHLINDYMPLEKKDVKIIPDEKELKFYTKDLTNKRHVCLTTYNGLYNLSKYLCDLANAYDKKKHNIEEFDYYKYDLSMLINAFDMLEVLGYKIIKK